VIVDEAHGVTADDSGKGGVGRTQRYELVRDWPMTRPSPRAGDGNAAQRQRLRFRT
jgi:hypothetical protein